MRIPLEEALRQFPELPLRMGRGAHHDLGTVDVISSASGSRVADAQDSTVKTDAEAAFNLAVMAHACNNLQALVDSLKSTISLLKDVRSASTAGADAQWGPTDDTILSAAEAALVNASTVTTEG